MSDHNTKKIHNPLKKSKHTETSHKMYKMYENKKISWKKTVLNNVVFDLPDYYQPVKLSKCIM